MFGCFDISHCPEWDSDNQDYSWLSPKFPQTLCRLKPVPRLIDQDIKHPTNPGFQKSLLGKQSHKISKKSLWLALPQRLPWDKFSGGGGNHL
jgi:hypothetical protein